MSNKSLRNSSPYFSQRDAKRPRLDATSSLHPSPPSTPSSGRMNEDGEDFKHEGTPCLADAPTHAAATIVHQQWPTSSDALASDPMAPGSCSHYFESGDYFSVTRTTSVPIAVSPSKPLTLHSSSTLGSSSVSSAPSLCPTPFTTGSPVSTFSSDTSAATHHSSTPSLDQAHDIFTSQFSQWPGGVAGLGFTLMLEYEGTAEAVQPEATHHDLSLLQPQERLTQSADCPQSVRDASFSVSPPSLSLHDEAPGLSSAVVPPDSSSPVPPPDAYEATGNNSHSPGRVFEPNLLQPADMSPFSHERASLHVESVGTPSQISHFTNPFVSTLARDALLSQAYRIYDSPASLLPSGLSPAPVGSSVTNSILPSHTYTMQLVPLLAALRTLHPHHLPTLLLYGCVLYALGDFNGSLMLNCEILHIDPNYVCHPSNFVCG